MKKILKSNHKSKFAKLSTIALNEKDAIERAMKLGLFNTNLKQTVTDLITLFKKDPWMFGDISKVDRNQDTFLFRGKKIDYNNKNQLIQILNLLLTMISV